MPIIPDREAEAKAADKQQRNSTEQKRLRSMAVDSAARVIAGAVASGGLTANVSFAQMGDLVIDLAAQLDHYIQTGSK